MSELESRYKQARILRIRQFGQEINTKHGDIQKAGTDKPLDKANRLMQMAELSGKVYDGIWDRGNLTPKEFSSPSSFRHIWQEYPELAQQVQEKLMETILSGEEGDPEELLKVAAEVDPDNPPDPEPPLVEGYLFMRARVTLGVLVKAMRDDADDLRVVLLSLGILDSSERAGFLDLPMRLEYLQMYLLPKWKSHMESLPEALDENWVALAETIMKRLKALEGLMDSIIVWALEDYTTRNWEAK